MKNEFEKAYRWFRLLFQIGRYEHYQALTIQCKLLEIDKEVRQQAFNSLIKRELKKLN